ncbi:MAG: hypothetical protein KatS3mg105_1382 [Gemmatales bacterium]|nr:MAG: hypothetical protein KatS3mg105_1382 [Gemmatales bacterium]
MGRTTTSAFLLSNRNDVTMQLRNPVLACFVIAATALSAPAQGRTIPAGDPQPILQIEAGGPTAFVTSLTFSPDGKRLYAAGFDKVVRVWNLNENTGRFELDPASYRIPIGPGIAGTINAIALSPDERWLAVGGQGIVRGSAGFRLPGLYLPKTGAYTEEMWLDEGTIYVFDTRTRLVRPLRGHLGPIWSLAFAPAFDGKPPLLVSTGRDRDMETASYKGSVRLWDVVQGELVAERTDMPNGTGTRPGLAAWHTGKELKQVRVGIAWEDGLLRVWDVASNRLMIAKDGWNGKRDGGYNNTAIWLPDARRLLTLSLRYPIDGQPAAMQIRQWSDDTNGPRETEVRSVTPTGVSAAMVPRALAPVSSQANGQIDQAAVVLLWKEQKDNTTVEDYYLYLRDLARDNFGGYLAYTRISVAGHLPALATSPKGKFIAVTGEHGRSIRLYSIQDLLRRKDKAQPQILRSIGQTFRFAAFVKKRPGTRARSERTTKLDRRRYAACSGSR